jgi:SAM-dependent methyltransferase
MRNMISLSWTLLRNGFDPNAIVTLLELRHALKDCHSVLDVGCGSSSSLRHFGFKSLTGIEGYFPDAEKARKNATHDELLHGDVRQLEKFFQPGRFDACVAMDVIEHLTREDGMELIRDMERIASKKIVFFTPSGFLPQGHTENADLQQHLSGWEPAEMKSLGYSVIGMLGPKSLRGEYHVLRRRPKIFWGLVCILAHFIWTRWRPAGAAAILCVKTK